MARFPANLADANGLRTAVVLKIQGPMESIQIAGVLSSGSLQEGEFEVLGDGFETGKTGKDFCSQHGFLATAQ